jgi:hypothetical protein
MRPWHLVLLIALLAPAGAHAAPCGTPGSADLFQQPADGGFIVRVFLAPQDLQAFFPAGQFTVDEAPPPGVYAFWLEGIHYQLRTTPVPSPPGKGRRPGDTTLLARHARTEMPPAADSPPLTVRRDFGTRKLAGRPLHLKVWRQADADGRVFQYFIGTVAGDRIVLLSALLPRGPDQDAQFRAVLAGYSRSLELVASCAAATAAADATR